MAFAKGITAEYVLFCTHKRVPERTAVPVGHESPGGAFKAQTGLRSKCCVFNTARSPLLSRRGRRRVAAPCVCFVPWTALASCRPLPQQLLPVSATGRGRRRCKQGLLAIDNPKAERLHTKNPSRCGGSSPQGSGFACLTLALSAVCRRDPSREKADQKSPQAFLICRYKNIFSAIIAKANAAAIPNRCCSVYTSHLPCARMKPTNQRR